MYFSAVPSKEWPCFVFAQLSSPQHQTNSDVDEEGSEQRGATDADERSSYVHEKLHGK